MTSLVLRHVRMASALAALGGAILLVMIYAPVARDLLAVWLDNAYYSYGLLVPLFSAYVAWDIRERLFGPPVWTPAGLALATGGLAVRALGGALGSLTLDVLSMPLVLAGVALFVLGRERLSALAFPLGFLGLMTPLPPDTIPALSLVLQQFAAWVTDHALALLGVPAVRRGLAIQLRTVTLVITEACNGLRFLLAMVVIGVALAWAARAGARWRVAVVGLAVVAAIVANLVRVIGTALLADRFGPEAAMGFFHLAYGKVVYLAMLIPFMLGVMLLRRRAA